LGDTPVLAKEEAQSAKADPRVGIRLVATLFNFSTQPANKRKYPLIGANTR